MLKKKGKHEDIIFEAGEDLYSATTGEIRLLKNGFKYIPIVNERRFESYFFEFCGLVSLSYKTLRFQMEHRDINPDKIVVSSCSIKVLHNSEFFLSPATSLRNSLELLQSSEIGSDLTITINENHKIQAHKCILACRSPVFATILADSSLSTLHISTGDEKYFKEMLRWIYTGDVKVGDKIEGALELLKLASKYTLPDLTSRCEEDILAKITPENVVDLLVKYGHSSQTQTQLLSNTIVDQCKTVFLTQFNQVLLFNPNVEELLASVPGLIIELFSHISKRKKNKNRRHVRFSLDNSQNIN